MEYDIKFSSNLIRPLPVFLVTTYSHKFGPNAAPMSAFTFQSYDPPRQTIAVHPKRDTYKNIIETGELVANIPIGDEENIDKLWICARGAYQRGINEITQAGLTPIESKFVKAPRIKESLASIEYQVVDVWQLDRTKSERPVILLKPLAATVKDDIIDPISLRYKPAAKIPIHLSGNLFRVNEKIIIAGKENRKQNRVFNWKQYMSYITGKKYD